MRIEARKEGSESFMRFTIHVTDRIQILIFFEEDLKIKEGKIGSMPIA